MKVNVGDDVLVRMIIKKKIEDRKGIHFVAEVYPRERALPLFSDNLLIEPEDIHENISQTLEGMAREFEGK